MDIIIILLIKTLDIYLWLIIASVVVSWLTAFGVLNLRNKAVAVGCRTLDRVVEPGLSLIRRVLPPMAGLDLTPMVMMFAIYIAQGLLISLIR